MSKTNTTIRTIPLEANCDLTLYNQEIHDYKDFEETNSLFLNKRITNWYKRNYDDDKHIYGNITYKVNEETNKFDIYDDDVYKFSINKEYYKLEQVEDIPTTITRLANPFTKQYTYYFAGRQWGTTENVDIKTWSNGSHSYLAIHPIEEDKVYFYEYDEDGNTELKTVITNSAVKDYHINILFIDIDDVGTINDTVIKYDFTNLPSDLLCFITVVNKDSNADWYNQNINDFPTFCYDVNIIGNVVPVYPKNVISGLSDNFKMTEYPASQLNWNGRMVHNGKTTIIKYLIIGGKIRRYFEAKLNSSSTDDYYLGYYNSDILNTTHFNSSVNLFYSRYYIKSNNNKTNIKYEFDCVENEYPYESEGHEVSIVDDVNIKYEFYNAYSLNYSKLFGKFAINFISTGTGFSEPETIGHNYKKLVYLVDGSNSVEGYTEKEIYFNSNGKKYKLSIAQTEKPQFYTIGSYYVVFNTTSYNNAYAISENTVFCANDDWNNRAIYTSENKQMIGKINSRSNNNWATSTEIKTVSSQYASVSLSLPVDDSGNTKAAELMVNYVDSNYTAPNAETFTNPETGETTTIEPTKYTVYFPKKLSGSAAGAMIQQGYINKNGFTVDKNEDIVYEDQQFYEDTPPLLLTNYLAFENNDVYIFTEKLSYKLSKFSDTFNNYPFTIYTTEAEQIVSQGDRQFIISGSTYMFRANSNAIYDINNQQVCNTELFIFIGYSTRMAYFYCLFDKGVYAFTGANIMTRLLTLEKYNVKYTTYQEGTADPVKVADALNIPSIDLVAFNLTDRIAFLFNNQICIVPVDGEINEMRVETTYGNIIVNGIGYTLYPEHYDDWEQIPIELTTEFYGAAGSERNTINDTVYLTVDNINHPGTGRIILKAYALQNMKILETKKKIIELKKTDFNEAHAALIKYQPEIQDCYGFKLYVKSDFEIPDIKISTAPSELNQTIYNN